MSAASRAHSDYKNFDLENQRRALTIRKYEFPTLQNLYRTSGAEGNVNSPS